MSDASTSPAEPQWKPLNSVQRRVLGVLIEKAKTTPGSYPMSLNGITTGCNQRSNRAPLMSLEPEDVEDVLEELRLMGAVGLIEGSGRVDKYRHYAYEWLAIDKPEAAVLAELLLRGEQTVGDLRGRAARMAKSLTDLAALRPILQSLQEKKLVIALSPEGRGQMVTHGMSPDGERPQGVPVTAAAAQPQARQESPAATATQPAAQPDASPLPLAQAPPPASPPPGVTRDMYNELQLEVAELRAELSRLRNQIEQIEDFIR